MKTIQDMNMKKQFAIIQGGFSYYPAKRERIAYLLRAARSRGNQIIKLSNGWAIPAVKYVLQHA